MAAVLIVLGGAMITERVERSKEKKRLKKEHDDTRYRELVHETGRRLSCTESGPLTRHLTGEDGIVGDALPPPACEHIARTQRRPTGGPEEAWRNGEEQITMMKKKKKKKKKKKGGMKALLNKIGS